MLCPARCCRRRTLWGLSFLAALTALLAAISPYPHLCPWFARVPWNATTSREAPRKQDCTTCHANLVPKLLAPGEPERRQFRFSEVRISPAQSQAFVPKYFYCNSSDVVYLVSVLTDRSTDSQSVTAIPCACARRPPWTPWSAPAPPASPRAGSSRRTSS